jgi:hypothetical protein
MSQMGNKSRMGASSLECVVAFTLLSSVLAFAAPLVVTHRRLVNGQREYRLALDEVANQLERLTSLPSGDVEQAVEQLELSEFAAVRLPEAKLRGELKPVDRGQQVTLSLTWEQPTAAPIVLTGWILSERAGASATADGGEQP